MEKLRGPAKFKDDEEIILDGDEREKQEEEKEVIDLEAKVLVILGTPFIKDEDKISAIVEGTTPVGEAVQRVIALSRKRAGPGIVDGIQRELGKDESQIKIGNKSVDPSSYIAQYARKKGGKYYVNVDVVSTQKGGYFLDSDQSPINI